MSEKFIQSAKSSDDEMVYTMNEDMKLLPFLFEAMPHRSRNSVKSILSRGQVQIDDYIVKQFDHIVHEGQVVKILKNKAAIRESTLIGLKIMHEDKDLIVVQKDAGLLSIASAKEKDLTAHNQLMIYVRAESPLNRVFVVHRLDKDTSGVMMFAKNERAKKVLQDSWREMVKRRSYMALVEKDVQKESGTITSWLRESKTRVVYSSQTKDDGLRAITHFKKIQSNKDYSLLEVELETGRKNQIRVHMQDMGHPVVGDKKYGSAKNAIGRLGLHAKVLAFIHPMTKEVMRFEAEAPESFYNKSGK